MAEYKLSYTASEIDEKLGKIDGIETQVSGLSEEIANQQMELKQYIDEQLGVIENGTY